METEGLFLNGQAGPELLVAEIQVAPIGDVLELVAKDAVGIPRGGEMQERGDQPQGPADPAVARDEVHPSDSLPDGVLPTYPASR